MKHWSINLYRPQFDQYGRFSLVNAQLDWGRADANYDGWLTLTLCVFGFSVVATYWPEGAP